MNIIRKKSAVLSGVAGLEYTSAPMATLVSVITLLLTGRALTPVNVFMLISYINVLRLSTSTFLAYGMMEAYDAYVSLGRIEDFLLLENLAAAISSDEATGDKRSTDSTLTKSNSCEGEVTIEENGNVFSSDHDEVKDPDKPFALCVSNLTFKQTNRDDEFILNDVQFTASPGSLTVITGPVGSGKSTLLSAIAGEVSDTSGTISCQGPLVYVPQVAWIFSGTIRENILFGHPYDENRYARTIEACALYEDVKQFPDGDQTIVGERGAVLSGGQQARVNLARAVYADGGIYLLDDPLSAVDFKVGKHIFERCIKELLGDKTRVLTSHQEQHMKEADEVIVLYKGYVLGKGSFTELQSNSILSTTVDPLYKKVMQENESNNNTEEGDEEERKISESGGRMVPLASEAKGLEISDEDRTIGVVSSKLYWDYLRSGLQPLAILGIVCLCVLTQGKSPEEVGLLQFFER